MAGEGTLVEELDEDLDQDEDNDAVDADGDGDKADSEGESEDEDAPVTLDALEVEELEIVESDESATMLVDEASEIMAIRREEMTMGVEADTQRGDEFVCQSCFLVLKSSQLANKRKMLCVDCV